MLEKTVVIIAFIAIVVSILVVAVCYKRFRWIGSVKDLYEKSNEFERKKAIQQIVIYHREQTLNRMLCAILFDLLHTDNKASLRWKFHILRKVEPLFNIDNNASNDVVYDLIEKELLNASKCSREDLIDEIKMELHDYYLLDLDEKEPFNALLDAISMADRNVDGIDGLKNVAYDILHNAALALDLDYQIMDTDPLGDLPNTTDASVLQGEGHMTREEMLEKLIAVSEQISEETDSFECDQEPDETHTIIEEVSNDESGNREEMDTEETA